MTLRERIRRSYGAAEEYERRWSRYLAASTAVTLEALQPRSGERILDAGCGTGLLLRKIAGRVPTTSVFGVDLTPRMLAVARGAAAGKVGFAVGEVERLAFGDGTFDAAVSSSSLHHWSDPTGAMGELARVIRPGGRIVITDWCRDVVAFRPLALWLQVTDRTVYRIYSLRELRELLEGAGLTIVSERRYRIATYWGMMTVVARLG